MKTTEAIRQIICCNIIIVSNIAHSINRFVTQHSWLAVSIIIFFSAIISVANIVSARTERDNACKKQYQLQQQVEQLSCALEARKEAGR